MVNVIDLFSCDTPMKQQILKMRSVRTLKLPDAIIAATAMSQDCILLTRDRKLLDCKEIPAESWS
jgi:predicted nucleic acid-binding protein